MKYRALGKTEFSVSEIGHGLWGMGGWSDANDEVSRAALRLSIEGGCTFFDSAFAYGQGHSDSLIGAIAGEYPKRPLVLASKIPPADGKWPSSPKSPLNAVFPRAHVVEHAEKIRRSFGRPIDLLQFHVWEDAWAHDAEWQDTVAELKSKRTIKAFGLSLNRWQPENGIAAIETGLVESVQVIYNIFDQAPEDQLFPACRKHNVGVIARVPLDEGSLGGKITLDTRFPDGDWRARYFNTKNLELTVARVEELKKLLPADTSLPEMALRFILSEPTVSTLIAGMRSAEHVRTNLAASDKGPLPADLIGKLRSHRWDRRPLPSSD
jgi:aryl-alcohol dehydrogenase-like predicted oxidoreductase